MTLTVIIILISLGLILILLEILVIPGTGFVGIIGLGLIIAGVWSAYSGLSTVTGNYTLLITALIAGILLYYTLKSKTWKKLMLNATIKGKVNTLDENLIKEGDTGITISRLAPIGKASINDNFYEVQSVTDFVDENKEIKVVKIEGSKIFVKLNLVK